MKAIFRFAALMVLIICLLLPAVSQAAEARDLSISVQWTDALGNVRLSQPATPVTDSPEETRFWLQLPWDAPLYGLTLNISDLTGSFVRFSPNQGDVLMDVQDANGSLDGPFVEITAFNAWGEPAGIYSLYFSALPMPQ